MEPELLEVITSVLFPSKPPAQVMRTHQLAVTPNPFTAEVVNDAFKHMATRRKVPGPDGLTNSILAAVHQAEPSLIKGMYNRYLEEGVFPDRWKQARLVLLRKGDKPPGEPSSYRPLCLLNDVGKLYELILVRRLESNLSSGRGLSETQFGFRKQKSTEDFYRPLILL